jgi:hypothetical protein
MVVLSTFVTYGVVEFGWSCMKLEFGVRVACASGLGLGSGFRFIPQV